MARRCLYTLCHFRPPNGWQALFEIQDTGRCPETSTFPARASFVPKLPPPLFLVAEDAATGSCVFRACSLLLDAAATLGHSVEAAMTFRIARRSPRPGMCLPTILESRGGTPPGSAPCGGNLQGKGLRRQ